MIGSSWPIPCISCCRHAVADRDIHASHVADSMCGPSIVCCLRRLRPESRFLEPCYLEILRLRRLLRPELSSVVLRWRCRARAVAVMWERPIAAMTLPFMFRVPHCGMRRAQSLQGWRLFGPSSLTGHRPS